MPTKGQHTHVIPIVNIVARGKQLQVKFAFQYVVPGEGTSGLQMPILTTRRLNHVLSYSRKADQLMSKEPPGENIKRNSVGVSHRSDS